MTSFYLCHRSGHLAPIAEEAVNTRDEPTFNNCGNRGHLIHDCRSKRETGGMQKTGFLGTCFDHKRELPRRNGNSDLQNARCDSRGVRNTTGNDDIAGKGR